MLHIIDADIKSTAAVYMLGDDFTGKSINGDSISFNNYYMLRNGEPFFAVSGEFHFTRMAPERWEDEIIKLRMGGVNTVATYIFWNHIEEEEGIFDFTGRRDLRRFTELCAKHGMYVILRVGPFAHGEARNGGLPDWLYGKPFEVRHTNPGFMACVKRLYSEIGAQVKGLFFKDGGPVIGVQLDNEYMHSSAMWEITNGVSNEWIFSGDEGEKYLLALRETALACGLTPAFFTATAWGGAAYSERIMPLWGGYAYWPWIFYSKKGEHPATPGYVYEDYHHDDKTYADDFKPPYTPSTRPYACCEMGGGMMNCYYYRFQLDYKSVDAMANIKIGSGCNFLGYYMFHGGTNPLGKHGAYLNESQVTKLSYDYQACLGEFGQVRESYRRVKALHFFTRFFGNRLVTCETLLPEGASEIAPTDLETLRWCVRTDGESGFVFINNFQDHRVMPLKAGEIIKVKQNGNEFTYNISLAPGENAVLPFNLDLDGILLKQACAQPVLRTVIKGRITYVFMLPDGMTYPAFIYEAGVQISNNGRLCTVKKADAEIDVMLVSRAEANDMYLLKDGSLVFTHAALLENTDGALRIETENAENTVKCYPADAIPNAVENGIFGIYTAKTEPKEIPVSVSTPARHRFIIELPENALEGLKDVRLAIDYRGDIATLFIGNEMINDNFCNGDVWEIGLKEHAGKTGSMLLNISPVRKGAAVNVESAMAARNETVQSEVAELIRVTAKPVYEIIIR